MKRSKIRRNLLLEIYITYSILFYSILTYSPPRSRKSKRSKIRRNLLLQIYRIYSPPRFKLGEKIQHSKKPFTLKYIEFILLLDSNSVKRSTFYLKSVEFILLLDSNSTKRSKVRRNLLFEICRTYSILFYSILTYSPPRSCKLREEIEKMQDSKKPSTPNI